MITDLYMPTEKLEQAIYDEEAEQHPPLNEAQRQRTRAYAKAQVASILVAQSLLTAKRDQQAMEEPYGGDIDLFGPVLGRSSDARDD